MIIYRFFLIFSIFFISILGYGQDQSTIPDFDKNYLGLENSISVLTHTIKTSDNNKSIISKFTYDVNFIYRRFITNSFYCSIKPGFFNFRRDFRLTSQTIENEQKITTEYDLDYEYQQFYFFVMPEYHFGDKYQLIIQGGLGTGLNIISDFKNGYIAITGYDGDFKRIKQIPGIEDSHWILKATSGIAFNTYYKYASFILGIRYSRDFSNNLKINKLSISSNRKEFYFSLLFHF